METPPKTGELTQLLRRWSDGDDEARARVLEQCYRELRQLAQSHLRRERLGHTLQPTALVNELYLRLAGPTPSWQDRHHFFRIASRIMRRLLIDHARSKRSARRDAIHVTLPLDLAVPDRTLDLLQLDDVLTRMEALFPREAQVVELRCFCGMSIEETAECLGVATGTVKRDWRFAKGFLVSQLA